MKKLVSLVLSLMIMASVICLPTFAQDKTNVKTTAKTQVVLVKKATNKTAAAKVVKKEVTHSLVGVVKSFDGKVIYLKSGRGTYHFHLYNAPVVGKKGIVVGAKATLVYSGTMGKNAKLVKVIMDYTK